MTLAPYERSAPYYDLIYRPIVDYGRECDLLEGVFLRHARREVRRILDLGSGTGNHALLLTDRGYEVVGVDLQPAFVERHREKARGRSRSPTFLVGDMRRLEVEGPFDAILCMFGAFGHLPRDDAPETLRGVRERLAEGGLLVFEFWNPAGAKDGHKHWDEREGDGFRLVRLASSRIRDGGRTVENSVQALPDSRRSRGGGLRGGGLHGPLPGGGDAGPSPSGRTGAHGHAGLGREGPGPAEGGPFRLLAVARREGEGHFTART